MIKKKKITHNGGDIMSHKKHRGNSKNSFTTNQKGGGNKLSNMKGRGNKVDDCYKMKIEHSEELNPDDFE